MSYVEIPDYDEPERTYLRRWRIIETPFGGIYLHNILMSDSVTRGFHDHPYTFLSIRLRRNYTERLLVRERCFAHGAVLPYFAAGGDEASGARWGFKDVVREVRYRKRFSIRRAEQLHQVVLDGGGVWTFVFHGRRRRQWGFRKPDGPWISQMDYARPYVRGDVAPDPYHPVNE
jgi:hypothetical protein